MAEGRWFDRTFDLGLPAFAFPQILARLRSLPDRLDRVALHPRLQQPVSVVDLGFFVAEHDDHHLATIAALPS